MRARSEDFRPADEVAGIPVGEGDLASGRGHVEDTDTAGLDQIDAFVRSALAEKRLAAVEHAPAALAQHQFALTRR